jgi:transposase
MQTSRIAVAPPERLELKRRAASRSGRSDDAKRAKLILKLAAGHSYSQIMKSLECSQNYNVRWKSRFLEERIGGLYARH